MTLQVSTREEDKRAGLFISCFIMDFEDSLTWKIAVGYLNGLKNV